MKIIQPQRYPREEVRERNTLPHGTPYRTGWYHWTHNDQPNCYWCKQPFGPDDPPTKDHVKPRSTGGVLTQGLVLAHARCNERRGTTPFNVYQRRVA